MGWRWERGESMNGWDVLILLGIAGAVVLAVRRIRKGRSGSCCGACDRCGVACGKREKNE